VQGETVGRNLVVAFWVVTLIDICYKFHYFL